MNNKQLIAVFIVVILLGAGSAVLLMDTDDRAREERWYNVDIVENIYPTYKEMSEKENFYAYVNNDIYKEAAASESMEEALKYLEKQSVNKSAESNIFVDVVSIFTGLAPVKDLGDADILDSYARMSKDMAARNAAGINAIQSYVLEIDSISEIDDMTRYIATGGSAAMHRAFFNSLQSIESGHGKNSMEIRPAGLPGLDGTTLADGSQEKYNYDLYGKMLERFDDIDSKAYLDAIKTLNDDIKDSMNLSYKSMTYSQLNELAFPFAANLKAYNDVGVEYYESNYYDWMTVMSDHYKQSNLMEFKSVAMYSLMSEAVYHLDDAAYQIMTELEGSENDYMDTWQVDYSGLTAQLVGKYYVNAYTDDTFIAWFTGFVDSCKLAAKNYFKNIEWLSDESKAKMLDKIDKMTVRLLGPSESQLQIVKYDGIKADSYYELIVKLRQANEKIAVVTAAQDLRQMWDLDNRPTDFNMYYNSADNSINLLMGYVREFLRPVDFNYSDNYEYVLGTIGAAVCHEITHGFDLNGSNYMPNGVKKEGWMFTDSEKKVFDKRISKLTDYICDFYLGEDQFLGEQTIKEVMADMGGSAITCSMLDSTSDYKSYFKALAKLEYSITTKDSYYRSLTDSHPPGMYRVNTEVQQMPKFYDVFGISEGDKMYLAPDDRVNVW